MAITTRFGGKIEILRTTGDGWCIVRTEDGREREWHMSDLRADGGLTEINEAIRALGESEDNRALEIRNGEVTTAQDVKDAIERLRRSKGLGPQEPPQDSMIYNRRQSDGTFRPLAGFFDRDGEGTKGE